MENSVEKVRNIRKDIIKDYSSKSLPKTNIDMMVNEVSEFRDVIVKEIYDEAPDVKSFVLVPNKNKGVNELESFKAGQYISIKLTINDIVTTRAYSLSSSPSEALKGYYRITIKRVQDGLVSNYMLDEVKVGDELRVSKPAGDFGYLKVRDEENVIGIAGGSGITPFISLAKAIDDGIEDCNLTVLYSVRTYDDIIFKKEIEEFNRKSKRVKFVITLTREEKEGYLNGHLNKEMIEPYIKEFNTVLMCGPKDVYKAMNEILLYFNIPRKCVHYENFFSDYKPNEVKTYKLRILTKGEVKAIECKSNETLLVSMEKAGIEAPSLCRVGECGFCRSILIDGKIKMVGGVQPKSLSENDYFHPCITYPESDIVLKLDI